MAGQPIEVFPQYVGKYSEELWRPVLINNPDLKDQGIKTILDIRSKLIVYYTGRLRYITKKWTTCGSTPTGDGVTVGDEEITVTKMGIDLNQCFGLFNQTILEFATRKGYDVNNMEGTEIGTMIMEMIIEGAFWDLLREMWFGDTASANAYFSPYDGFIKKIRATVLAGLTPNVPIASAAAIDTPLEAYTLLLAVINNRELPMSGFDKKKQQILVTGNIYDLYETYISTLNGSETSYYNVVNGVEQPMIKGFPVIKMNIWDEIRDANPTIKDDSPYGMVIMTTDDESLILAVDAQDDWAKVEAWFEKKDEKNYWRVRYFAGTFIKYPDMLSTAGLEVYA